MTEINAETLKEINRQIDHILTYYIDDKTCLKSKLEELVINWYWKGILNLTKGNEA